MFSEEEFKASFEKVDRDGSGFITADEVENLLFETYGFPPLEEEVKSKYPTTGINDKVDSIFALFNNKEIWVWFENWNSLRN